MIAEEQQHPFVISTITAKGSVSSQPINLDVFAANVSVTLPTASANAGRVIVIKNLSATYTVISASSNVKPANSDTAGTAILAATAGAWAMLVCDGTNWVIMAS